MDCASPPQLSAAVMRSTRGSMATHQSWLDASTWLLYSSTHLQFSHHYLADEYSFMASSRNVFARQSADTLISVLVNEPDIHHQTHILLSIIMERDDRPGADRNSKVADLKGQQNVEVLLLR